MVNHRIMYFEKCVSHYLTHAYFNLCSVFFCSRKCVPSFTLCVCATSPWLPVLLYKHWHWHILVVVEHWNILRIQGEQCRGHCHSLGWAFGVFSFFFRGEVLRTSRIQDRGSAWRLVRLCVSLSLYSRKPTEQRNIDVIIHYHFVIVINKPLRVCETYHALRFSARIFFPRVQNPRSFSFPSSPPVSRFKPALQVFQIVAPKSITSTRHRNW